MGIRTPYRIPLARDADDRSVKKMTYPVSKATGQVEMLLPGYWAVAKDIGR